MNPWTIETNAKQCRVKMEGDLTASVVPELQPALKKELERGALEIVFELGKTVMLDSTGIGFLIAAYNSVSRRHGRIQVMNVSPEILQLLESMRLVNRLNASARTT